MKAEISEIFQSIQGEGKYAGVKQVFVRFLGCNMPCAWCDTPYARGGDSSPYEQYDLDGLFKRIADLWGGCHSVSLTGGEPLIQKAFIKELLAKLKEADRVSYLETNGILYEELGALIDDINIISMDIKLPSSAKCRGYWQEHEEFLRLARRKDVFIKTVVSSKTDKDDMIRAVDLVRAVDRDIFFIIQPNSFDLNNGVMKKCLGYQNYGRKHLSNVRVMPQMHKVMGIR